MELKTDDIAVAVQLANIDHLKRAIAAKREGVVSFDVDLSISEERLGEITDALTELVAVLENITELEIADRALSEYLEVRWDNAEHAMPSLKSVSEHRIEEKPRR